MPLILFHFSGMTPDKPHEYARSQTRTLLANIPSMNRLVQEYHRALGEAEMNLCVSWGCEFAALSDGSVIKPAWREAIRQHHRKLAHVENPFDVSRFPEVISIFKQLESRSHKWRKDWRLLAAKEKGVAGKFRQANKQLKSFFKGFRNLRRSA